MEHPAFRQLTVSVRQAIDAGRVGVPSVVRWYVRTTGGSGHRPGLAATGGAVPGPADTTRSMLAAASNWLDGEPAMVKSFGREGGAESVVHAAWPAGTAAVLIAAHGGGEPANDLIVLGSRGALYFGRTPDGVPF